MNIYYHFRSHVKQAFHTLIREQMSRAGIETPHLQK